MGLKLLIILVAASVLARWLSGYDAAITGEIKLSDFKRRAWRCGITLALVCLGGSVALGIVGARAAESDNPNRNQLHQPHCH